jgi:hypothetical protein
VHRAFLRTGFWLSLILSAQNARAQLLMGRATLLVNSPPNLVNCVDPAILRVAVQNQLGERATTSQNSLLAFEVNIHQTRTQIVADLHLTGKSIGKRTFEAARCEGLLDALAVTIAMILDEDARENHVDSKDAVPRESLDSAEKAREEAPREITGVPHPKTKELPSIAAVSPTDRSTQGFHLGADRKLRAFVAGGYGTQTSYLFDVGAEFSYRNWAARVGASYEPTRRLTLGDGSVDLMRMSGFLAACYRFKAEVSFVPCLRTDIGANRVKSNGFGANESRLMTTVFTGPTIGLETGKRWIWGFELIGQLAGWRDRYVVQYLDDQAKTPIFVAWLVARIALSN